MGGTNAELVCLHKGQFEVMKSYWSNTDIPPNPKTELHKDLTIVTSL